MKFAALLKKELRICLPWLLLCMVVFVVIGSIMMHGMTLNNAHRINYGPYHENYINEHYSSYSFTLQSPIVEFAGLILVLSLALGLVLGFLQFFLPGLSKTWAFTIHRSINPQAIIWSKFTAAAITFGISLGLLWTLFYSYAAVPGRFYIPVFFRTYLEGWVYIFAGLITYWGTALSAVSTTRFYTTRLLGLTIATFLIILLLWQPSIAHAVMWTVIGAFILIIQIIHTFLTREF
ncbi:MAG: hypothetical protein ACYTET_04205 [Planctomycetota bacterium]|jgi:hypothetical protein